MTGRGRRGERGSGSVLGLVLAVLVLSTGATIGLVGMGVAAMHRARAAADLAALAGANALATGGRPCEAAELLAVRNGAELVECGVAGARVDVRVGARPGWTVPLLPELVVAEASAELG